MNRRQSMFRNRRISTRCRIAGTVVASILVAATPVVASTPPTEPPTTIAPPDPIRDAPVVSWPGPGQVALTFDDGPHPTTTPMVLDILDREKVPGTFFVVCRNVPRDPGSLLRMSLGGHSVQNHTMNHPYLSRTKTPAATAELATCSDVIEASTGRRPTSFRPPYGSHNERIDGLAASIGLRPVMWNSTAPVTVTSAKEIVRVISGQIAIAERKGRGLVILLHDGSGARAAQVAALGPLIHRLKTNGWQFVKIA